MLNAKRGWILGLGVVAALAIVGARVAAPEPSEAAKKELEGRLKEALVKASRRHIELGIWCRDAGMVSQASNEFVRAVEISEGKDQWAVNILNLMRKLDDAFWKKVSKNPGAAMLRTYGKRAQRAVEAALEDRVAVAKWAGKKKGLDDEAYRVWVSVVRATDQPITVDAQGQVTLPVGTIPPDISKRLVDESVTINGRRWVRDEFLAKMPEITTLDEAEADALRVRTQGGPEQAQDLLAICLACLPQLEADTGGRPTRRMQVFVFGKRADYATYMDRAGMPEHKLAAGVADGATFTTVIAGEGMDAETLRGVTLHEMSHLYQYGVTPVVMPSWYAEGFAETYGGPGTFTWDGAKLVAGGLMTKSRLEPLQTDAGYIPLATLMAGDALKLINESKGGGPPFYSESWALRRWFRTAAPEDVRERFALWETMCRGAALGATVGKPNQGDVSPAMEAFTRLLGKDMVTLEPLFRAWLSSL